MRATGLLSAICLAATLGVSTPCLCAPADALALPHAPLSASDAPTHPGLKSATVPSNRDYGDEPGDAMSGARPSRHGGDSGQTADKPDTDSLSQPRNRFSAHSAVLDTLGVSHDTATGGGGDDPRSLGLTVRPLTTAERQAIGVGGGLMVTDVTGGLGLRAGFQPGDVVLSLDGVDLTSADQFYKLAQKRPHDRPVPVLVRRPNTTLFLPLGAPSRR